MATRAFRLTSFDPAEDFDDTPASTVSLEAWLEAHQTGAAPFALDPYEGVGLTFDDGVNRWATESFGDPDSMAQNLMEVSRRLTDRRVAVLRSAILDIGTYVVLIPEDRHLRLVQVLKSPPMGRVWPYVPNRAGGTKAEAHALYAWLERQTPALLRPTRSPAHDRARGLPMRLPMDIVCENILEEARIAAEVAKVIGTSGASVPGSASGAMPSKDFHATR